MNNSFECAHRVKFDLFLRFGMIAAAGDRHLAEFMPVWYTKSPEMVKEWLFGLTSVDWRDGDLAKRLARSEALISGEEEIEMKPSGEEGHLLIKALLGLGSLVSNVNVPNVGQVANLPPGAVVETNALFRRGEIQPVSAGAIPSNVLPLVSRHAANQRNTMLAAISRDYKLALTTFLNDPMTAALTPVQGDGLLKTMLRNTKNYLEGWDL
ncbi:hypothetical protein FACS1894202_13960 [Clostridia bacterium]|nr:hypothetical protein FACS1894202_13960 [Clostridia bacterium]